MTTFRKEIRLRLIHEFEKGTKLAEVYQILQQIFGEEAPTRMTCYNRYHEYLQGNRQLKNNTHNTTSFVKIIFDPLI